MFSTHSLCTSQIQLVLFYKLASLSKADVNQPVISEHKEQKVKQKQGLLICSLLVPRREQPNAALWKSRNVILIT